MDTRKNKRKSKDDVTWIKPETRKSNLSAAKCAQNKEKTSKLVELHERKIKEVINNKKDELKGIKMNLKYNYDKNFQTLVTKHREPTEETTQREMTLADASKREETAMRTYQGQEDTGLPPAHSIYIAALPYTQAGPTFSRLYRRITA